MMERLRLDSALVARGLVATRARARDLVLRRAVRVAGVVVEKPAQLVAADTLLAIDDEAALYVARSAMKLIAGLDHFGFDAEGRTAIDVGASTGGFTQVLLMRGAAKVHAVDVGHGQLHPSIAGDPRVRALEGTDARSLDGALIDVPVGAIVSDVSFISLTKALPAALMLAAADCWLLALIKPQFELSPAAIGKGGIVRDPADGERAVATVRAWLAAQPGWHVLGTCPSPLAGKGGNVEHLIGARFHGR